MRQGYLQIGDNVFNTLLAISSDEQSKGLMYESWPPPVMSFVYAFPKITYFWMKNTPSPLDIVFCCDNKIQKICKGEPLSTSLLGHDEPSDLIVELPFGTINSLDVKEGYSIELFNPSKKELNNFLLKNFNI